MRAEEIKNIAVEGVRPVKKLLPELPIDTEVQLEYSLESFGCVNIREVCEAVMNEWEPTEETDHLNLPATVDSLLRNVHADQIEWFCTNMQERNKAVISLHTHNDRELNGSHRTWTPCRSRPCGRHPVWQWRKNRNLDIATVALNMYARPSIRN